MENLPEIKTILVLILIASLFVSRISAQLRIWKLKEYCNSLKQANDNITKTFPDISVLVKACHKQEKEVEPAEPAGLQVYRAVRTDGAPDISLGDVVEVLVVAQRRSDAMKLLRELEQFKDDDWWILEDIKEEKILHIKHLGEL